MMKLDESSRVCVACGMPLNYDSFITGNTAKSADSGPYCSFCADPRNQKQQVRSTHTDNAWILELMLAVYRSHRTGMQMLAKTLGKLGAVLPTNILTLARLIESVPGKRNDSDYDAMVLYSGGKDSSYMLLDVARRNLRVCAWMLDQGYQSPTAIQNATELCKKLDVPLIIEKPDRPAMDALFRLGFNLRGEDSSELSRAVMTYGSACWPCFATIAAASTVFCAVHKIPFCFIGTQEGQNRLDLNGKPALAGRGLPHLDDLVMKFMKPFRDYAERIHPSAAQILQTDRCSTVLVPFYEFVRKPSFEAQLATLTEAGWTAPKNTGFCSTNCMINELGRKVMRTRFGFDLYQIIDAHERRLGNQCEHPDNPTRPDLDEAAVLRGAKMIGLTEQEAQEYGIEGLNNPQR